MSTGRFEIGDNRRIKQRVISSVQNQGGFCQVGQQRQRTAGSVVVFDRRKPQATNDQFFIKTPDAIGSFNGSGVKLTGMIVVQFPGELLQGICNPFFR